MSLELCKISYVANIYLVHAVVFSTVAQPLHANIMPALLWLSVMIDGELQQLMMVLDNSFACYAAEAEEVHEQL